MFGMERLTARVARLESQVRVQGDVINALAERLGVDPVPVNPRVQLDNEELDLVRAGKSIQAIKHHRERTGSSLLEGKDAVDRASRS